MAVDFPSQGANHRLSADQQLRRKVEAVSLAIASDPELRALLDLTEDRLPTRHHGWISDTSIECDHQRFAGFLKVSVEEVLIALRDGSHLLNDPNGLLAGNCVADQSPEADTSPSAWTPYPDGFSAERFIEVIETEAVWDLRDRAQHRPTLNGEHCPLVKRSARMLEVDLAPPDRSTTGANRSISIVTVDYTARAAS